MISIKDLRGFSRTNFESNKRIDHMFDALSSQANQTIAEQKQGRKSPQASRYPVSNQKQDMECLAFKNRVSTRQKKARTKSLF